MKARKGQINYLAELKKYEMINCALEWGLVIGVILLARGIFGKFLNFGTLIGLIGSLIAIKDTLILSVKLPFKPMEVEVSSQLQGFSEYLTVLYNPLMASRDKVMGVDAIVISGTTVLMCITNPKTDAKFTEGFVNTIITKRKVEPLNVKCYTDTKTFLDRVEGLHNMAKITKQPTSIEEKKIRGAILKYTI